MENGKCKIKVKGLLYPRMLDKASSWLYTWDLKNVSFHKGIVI